MKEKIKSLKDCLEKHKRFKSIYIISFEKLYMNKDLIVELFTSLSLSGKMFNPPQWQFDKIYIMSNMFIEKLKDYKWNKDIGKYIRQNLKQPSLCHMNFHSKNRNVVTFSKIFKGMSFKQISMIHEYLKSYLEKEVSYKSDKSKSLNLYKRLILNVIGYTTLIIQKKHVVNERWTRWIAISACLISLIAIIVDVIVKK